MAPLPDSQARIVFALSRPVMAHARRWAVLPAEREPHPLIDLGALIGRLSMEEPDLAPDLSRFRDVLVGGGAERIRRAVATRVPPRLILELEDRATASGWAPVHGALAYWMAEGLDENAVADLERRVEGREFPSIGGVWRELTLAEPSPVDAGPNPLSAKQDYLDSAPSGIDARHAWAQGLDGAGVGLVLIDSEYDLAHPDLPGERIAEIEGFELSVPFECKVHGTKALGVIVARDDTTGVVGMAPATDPVWAGAWKNGSAGETHLASAIYAALAQKALRAGDVLLLEAQRSSLEPVEFALPVRDAIAVAVGAGAVVVEPAGNGGLDLDDLDPGHPHSGAILVASARKPTGPVPPNAGPHALGHEPMRGSVPRGCGSGFTGASMATNYGARVDCHAWGECVYTTASSIQGCEPDADLTGGIYAHFGKTSAAAAIIAGAAILVQQYRLVRGQPLLDSEGMRKVLSAPETSTHQVPVNAPGGGAMAIGVMPDLRAVIGTVPVDPCAEAERALARCDAHWWPWRWLCRLLARLRVRLCRMLRPFEARRG